MKKLSALILFYAAAISFISFNATGAFFNDSANSTNNTFTAAATFPTGTPNNLANHIVISEVQIDAGTGTTASNQDFIELYNPTNSPISLSGLSLVKRTASATTDTNVFTFTSLHSIPAHGFFLWANDDFIGTPSADVESADTLAINNSIALKNSAGAIIDALSWNPSASSLKEGTEYPDDPGANQSLERKAYSASTIASMTSGDDISKGNGEDSNNNSADFILRATSQPQNSSSPAETP